MKRFFSLVAFYARGSLPRILIALAVLCAVQAGVFLVRVDNVLQVYAQQGMREFIMLSPVHLLSIWAFLYISWKLLRQGASAVSERTMARLPVSRRMISLAQILYNLAVLFLFWAVLTALYYGLWNYYLSQLPETYVSPQGFFYWSYVNPTLHGFLPMEDGPVWVRNFLWLMSLSVSLAAASDCLRRGRNPLSTYLLLMFLLFTGVEAGIGSTKRTIVGIVVPLFLMFIEMIRLVAFDREEKEDEGVEHHA